MSHNNTSMQKYLKIIEQGLHNFPDKEFIIQELRDYILDLASDIAISSNKSQSECFNLALDRLEKPEILIAHFKQENANLPSIKKIKRSNKLNQFFNSKKKTNLGQKAVFSLLTLAFIYLLARIINFSTSLPGNPFMNAVRVIFITILIGGLTFLFDKGALIQQRQKLRNIFSREKGIIKVKIGKFSLPIINTRIIQKIKLIFTSILTVISVFLLILNWSMGLNNLLAFLIVSKIMHSVVALVIMSFSILISNIIQYWIKPKQKSRIISFCNNIIKLAAVVVIINYYPINFEYLSMFLHQNMQALAIYNSGIIIQNFLTGYLFIKTEHLLYQIFSSIINYRRDLQENRGGN